jgi:hypothetical protein
VQCGAFLVEFLACEIRDYILGWNHAVSSGTATVDINPPHHKIPGGFEASIHRETIVETITARTAQRL